GERTRILILDTRHTTLADLKQAASHYHVSAVGSLWLMDRNEAPGPIDGYAMDEREPSLWQWLWLRPLEPARSIGWSRWARWEGRTLRGQPAPPPPQTATATLDEIRIAHNAAVDRHDDKTAAALRARIQSAIDLPRTAIFDGDTSLMGAIHH